MGSKGYMSQGNRIDGTLNRGGMQQGMGVMNNGAGGK